MPERLKQILQKLLKFWNKYTNKQKTIIISVVAAIFFAIVLLYTILTRPQYVQLQAFEDRKSASELTALLDDGSIDYNRSEDGTVVYVNKDSYTKAMDIMDRNDIPGVDYSWEDALSNDMSVTETEKNKKISLATQSDLRNNILNFKGVKDAHVMIDQPQESDSIFSEKQETSVAVQLDLKEKMSYEIAEEMAKYVATAVGDKTTDSISIVDTAGNSLFNGSSKDTLGGNINGVTEYKQKLTNTITDNVEKLLLKYGYSDVQIGSANIAFDMDKVEENYTEYTVSEGQEQGYYSSSYNYASKGSNGSGGVPGTDSNDENTDYMVDNATKSDSEVTLDKYNYLPNQKVQNITHEVGAVKPKDSTIAVVATNFKVYNEEAMKKQGQLKGKTFEEFMAANNQRVEVKVEDQVVELVAAATGISSDNIKVVAWEKPIFEEKEDTKTNATNYLMIVLLVLIIALLIYVVFKGTAPVEVTELEPELSVEQLLATTKENQSLDDIEFSDKSETRKMIEKFVDENPEAVAQLLRNWLNEDWG